MLKMASSQGYMRASYALGLVLRDSQADEAAKYMKMAANAGYLPALQEVLPAREMKEKYGEPNADELRRHLDHLCLNRLLSRHYVRSPDLRNLNTSHCWNPLCGRWAFKATAVPAGVVRNHRPWIYPPNNRATVVAAADPPPPVNNTDNEAVRATRNNTPEVAGGNENNANEDNTTGNDVNINEVDNIAAAPAKPSLDFRVSRMKMCSRCCRAKYCSKLCQVYDWRSGRHKTECQFL